jgi:hypothetical protein
MLACLLACVPACHAATAASLAIRQLGGAAEQQVAVLPRLTIGPSRSGRCRKAPRSSAVRHVFQAAARDAAMEPVQWWVLSVGKQAQGPP